MIFVTVGTHEQPFNRLIECIDQLKENALIDDEVIIQSGYSTYEPQYCKYKKLYPYQQMMEFVKEARIVITHGGPSSFIMPLQIGKIPIIVPRQKRFGEHVNDHQVYFLKQMAERLGNILVVEDIEDLQQMILNYENIIDSLQTEIRSNNAVFNERFENIVKELFTQPGEIVRKPPLN